MIAEAFVRSTRTVIKTLGTDVVWTRNADPLAIQNLRVGFRSLGKDDQMIVNAYGLEAKIITVLKEDVLVAPEKFDTFTVGGTVYVAHAVLDVRINDLVVAYKITARGK